MAIAMIRKILLIVVMNLISIAGGIFITINLSYLYFPFFVNKQMVLLTGVNKFHILEAYRQMVSYLEFPWISKLKVNDFSFSIHGLIHMAEVKQLFLLDFSLIIIGIILLIIVLQKDVAEPYLYSVKNMTKFSMIFIPVLGTLALSNFNQSFIMMHQLLFKNNYWMFDPAIDPIINILPDYFFGVCFVSILVCYEIIMWQIYRKIKRRVV